MPHGSAFNLSSFYFSLLLLPFRDISLLHFRVRVAFFLSIAPPPGLQPWLTTSPTTPMRCQLTLSQNRSRRC
ncbi:hypothetical protein ACN42_g4925 [Penicillium freii]|uniref:Uncharacterized protein n=1 Tax=Penicillium freii TaxID=48697 RepID=A0A101MKF7_PENFR|nr:hypothetical protein ACN42_g4925 [Penicillium freii]